MENVRKNIKIVTSKARKNYLVLEPNYETVHVFFQKFISHRNE